MSKVLNLYQSLDQESQQYTEFVQNLLSISSDLPFNTDEVNTLQSSIISSVNSRLNQTTTRHEGLKILLNILPRCSKEILSKYATLWISKATQVFENSHSTLENTDLAGRVLVQLVVACKEISEQQKQISMQSVKQLITLISDMEESNRSVGAFYVIATLLYHYREPCERLQATIQKIILPLIDSNQKHFVEAGSKCFTLLVKATERSFTPPVTFPDYTCAVYNQALICNSLHVIMDELFSGVVELNVIDIWGSLELPSIPQDNVIDHYCRIERRFQNLCVYLSRILGGCAGRNSVCPNLILKLLCRGLAVTPSNLQEDDSVKKHMLYLILPKIHMSLFSVLSAFINGFRQELVPYALTVLQLYRQTLKWTDKADEANNTTISGSRPFKNVRIAVYQSLTHWLSCLGTSSGIDMIAEDLLLYIFKDITPEREEIRLTIQKTSNMSKKALKKFKDSQYENSIALGNVPKSERNPLVNAELCKEALVALQHIFYNSGVVLEPVSYRATQELIVPVIYDFYLGKDEDSLYYKNAECRLNLLKTLRAIQMNPHPTTPSPIQYSMQLFNMALNDNNRDIVNEAKVALAELDKIVHPSAPTLQFPVTETSEVTNPNDEMAQRAEERDGTDRIRNLVKQINDLRTEDSESPAEERPSQEVEDEKAEARLETSVNEEKEVEIQEILEKPKSDDIEVIENGDEPPTKKQKKLQIIEDIIIVPSTSSARSPQKATPIEETPENSSEYGSQKSIGSTLNEEGYFTIKDVQRVSDNSSMSSDHPVEVVKEINPLSDDISVIEDEPKSPRNESDLDEEAILSLFCDQVREDY